MTPAMEELVVNFLLRMTFLLGDGKDSRDREMVALLKHTQIMFSEALKLWPNVRLMVPPPTSQCVCVRRMAAVHTRMRPRFCVNGHAQYSFNSLCPSSTHVRLMSAFRTMPPPL